MALVSSGCRINSIESARTAAKIASIGSKPIVSVKSSEPSKFGEPLRRWLLGRPDPSKRTLLFLRKNNLYQDYVNDPQSVVRSIQKDCRSAPNMESVHAMAELAELEASWFHQTNRENQAAKYYATAVVHAYQFLFDPKLNLQRNAYDPQFREICDIYNRSLENLLRLVCKSDSFEHGDEHLIGDEGFGVMIDVEFEGRWSKEEFAKFELVSNYEINGIDNSYQTFGLGVPLIAIRKPKSEDHGNANRVEKYYPPSLALPLTAFCEVHDFESNDSAQILKATLKLFDPLEKTVVKTETRDAPLESDLTVPLAFYLNDPLLKTDILSTVSLLDAEITADFFGFYMLEPFDEKKIPVVMVHGLWSNPVTWVKMFNDLRADESIRNHYQFWFYMYPTGQPFWLSAKQMRDDLAQLREDVDPHSESQALQQMVLVGHSMGGLVSRMQTIDSGDSFWNILSERPIDEVKGDPDLVNRIRNLFFFESDPSIKKVITIASPHKGSRYANNATRFLSHQLFRLPKIFTDSFDSFVSENRGILRNTKHLRVPTSVDSLAPDSPFIQKLAQAKPMNDVVYHNIIGVIPEDRFWNKLKPKQEGDGVVSLQSARCPNSVSEIEVPAEHMEVHQHPESILEVKRILIENLIRAPEARPMVSSKADRVSYEPTSEATNKMLSPKIDASFFSQGIDGIPASHRSVISTR